MSTIVHRQRGISLIEVLVTVIILSIGLLGVAGLQSRLQQSEMEAYQRSQALLLLNDMANRIASNRSNASSYSASYGPTNPLGVGMNCPANSGSRMQRDASEWCSALQGAGEISGTSSVGAMLGGRGCVESLGSGQYLITVAWQGLFPLTAPPAGVACGANSYGSAGSTCADDVCRRVVTTIVRVATL